MDTRPLTHAGRSLICVLAVTISASCGGSDDDTAADPDTATTTASDDRVTDRTSTAPSTVTVTTDAPSATEAPATTSTPPSTAAEDDLDDAALTPRPIRSLLLEPAGSLGWSMPAGTWTTTAFDTPYEFETGTDLVVQRESVAAVFLVDPTDAEGRITIMSPAEVSTSEGPQAPPLDMMEFLEAAPNVTIERSTRTELDDGDVLTVADVVIEPSTPDSAQLCDLGESCLVTMRSEAGDPVFVLAGTPVRFISRTTNDAPIIVTVNHADDERFALLADTGEQIATSLTESRALVDQPELDFLGALGTRGQAAATRDYVAHLGPAVATFTLGPNGPFPAFVGTEAASFVEEGTGLISVTANSGHLGPDAEFATPPTPDQLLADQPVTTTDFDEWLRSMVAVIETGTATVDGTDATWWTYTVDDTVRSVPCGGRMPLSGNCVDLMITSNQIWFASDQQTERIYLMEDPGIVIIVESFGPDLDPIETAANQLLDGLHLTPTRN